MTRAREESGRAASVSAQRPAPAHPIAREPEQAWFAHNDEDDGAQAASRRAASGSAQEDRPRGSARHRTLAEQLADPSVITDYRPGTCPYEYSEAFGGPLGPRPVDAVRGVLRNLGKRPEDVLCDPDPTSENRAYLSMKTGDRLARITGLTAEQVNDALIALFASGWEPFANREAGLGVGARTAADHMPAPAVQGRFL